MGKISKYIINVSIIILFNFNLYSKTQKQTQQVQPDINSIICELVKLDNEIDEVYENITLNSINKIKDKFIQINKNQITILTSDLIKKEEKEKFRFINLISYKIHKKILKLSREQKQFYRLSPSSSTSSTIKKDLLDLVKEKEDIKNSLDELLKVSSKLSATSSWIYKAAK